MEIINQSRVDFNYSLSPSEPIIYNTIFSNIVKTIILEKLIVPVKEVDKSFSCIYDILTYTICITSKSMYHVTNVFFQDIVPKGEKFICNSVQVNNHKDKNLDPNCGFYIGTLKPFSKCFISFNVLVLQDTIGMTIENHANITYDYIYNLEKPPIRVRIKTNNTCTTVENSLFKQINISNRIKMCNPCICNKDIIRISTKINIIQTKIITTPRAISQEGVCLTGFKILIIGVVKYSVTYFDRESFQICCRKFIRGFSSSMIVPKGICYFNKPEVNISTESTLITALKSNCFKVDSTLLISLI